MSYWHRHSFHQDTPRVFPDYAIVRDSISKTRWNGSQFIACRYVNLFSNSGQSWQQIQINIISFPPTRGITINHHEWVYQMKKELNFISFLIHLIKNYSTKQSTIRMLGVINMPLTPSHLNRLITCSEHMGWGTRNRVLIFHYFV